MIKTRIEESANYKGIWFNGKTLRFALDPDKPITELEYPEFYDVDIFGVGQGLCKGNCPYCYLSAESNGTYVSDAIEKINKYFGSMTENQRPFQVALPGSGECTMHPDFLKIIKTFSDLGIQPNYTTNGMWSREYATGQMQELITKTYLYCGGVAVSCHPHLKYYWTEAAKIYSAYRIKLNFHIIISNAKSIDNFVEIYRDWKNYVDYFVLLPYGEQGRATHKDIDWEYLLTKLPEDQSKLAFGAHFYPYLLQKGHQIKVSLYEPEIMSKFLDLKGSGTLYKSSFDLKNPVKTNLFV